MAVPFAQRKTDVRGLTVERISEHVWWMPPGPPDRPSLCAVVGERWTLALDAGSSRAHTRAFLDGLPSHPRAVVYTHAHWDHVFGGVEVGGIVVAHRLTVPKLEELAARDWSDEGIADYRYAADIKEELPSPRVIEVARPDVVFDKAIDFDLGGVTVHVEHVGGVRRLRRARRRALPRRRHVSVARRHLHGGKGETTLRARARVRPSARRGGSPRFGHDTG